MTKSRFWNKKKRKFSYTLANYAMSKGAGISLACRETTGSQHPAERQHQCIDRLILPPFLPTIILSAHIIYETYYPHSLSFHSLILLHSLF